MKICPAGVEGFHADRRMDVTKLSRFSQFCERAQ